MAAPINNKPTPGGKFNWIKWFIWIPWVLLILTLVIQSGGYRAINPFYELKNGVTFLTAPIEGEVAAWYMIYYIVVAVFLILALLFGRQSGCHTICWMAPFMIIGRWIRNRFAWPSLRLVAKASACTDCKLCTKNCPMSLDVHEMVQANNMEHTECVLCGNCVDNCAKGAIHYSFSGGK